jgi:translation initiation factor IF-2
MKIPLDKINVGTIWTILAGCVAGVVFMFNTFARASEVQQKFEHLELDIAYGQFYDRLDDYEEALGEEREELAKEYLRQMERLRAKICELDPEWERCDD